MPIDNFHSAYSALNASQRAAVDAIEGPVMVLAGPGTGKTQTLALRVANILQQTDTSPDSILALTYTDSGTKAMQQRLAALIGTPAYRVNISTFHSFCASVIHDNPEYFTIAPGTEPISELNQLKLIAKLLTTLSLHKLRPLGNPGYYIRSILQNISQLKREGHSPESYVAFLDKLETTQHQSEADISAGAKIKQDLNLLKNRDLSQLYSAYQAELIKSGQYDYDDMISQVATSFRAHPDLLTIYQERFQYLLVDEYQDTNSLQNQVVSYLASYWGDRANLFVVGDPDQCIMRFQGASLENVLSFIRQYPDAKIISLTTNYRSPQNILDAAHSLISHNALQITNYLPSTSNHLQATSNELGQLIYRQFNHNLAEEHYITTYIQDLLAGGVAPSDIAIIYRHNKDVQDLSQLLYAQHLPYIIQGGGNILEDRTVIQLVSILKLLVALRSRVEDLDLFIVLHYPFLRLEPLDILRLSRSATLAKESLWEQIINSEQLSTLNLSTLDNLVQFRQSLLRWQQLDATSTTVELVETIFRESGMLDYCLSQPDGQLKLGKVNAFFAAVKNLNQQNHELSAQTLISDLDLMQKQGIRIKDITQAEGESAITLTTAHSAKGREWPYVIIFRCIDKSWGNNRNVDLIPLPPELISSNAVLKKDRDEDERRLMYVALTRARRSCLITSSQIYRQGGIAKEVLPTMFLGELGDGLQREIMPSLPLPSITTTLSTPLSPSERDYLSPLINDFVFSATALNTYLQCPYKFKLYNLLRIPRAKAPHQELGTAIHRSLELFYRVLGRTHLMPPLTTVVENFAHALKQSLLHPTQYQLYYERGVKLLTQYYNHYADSFLPALHTEYSFGTATAPLWLTPTIKVSGKVDRIDLLDAQSHQVRVVDYKTGHPKTRNQILGKTAERDASYYRQLVFYRLLLELDPSFKSSFGVAQLDFIEPDAKGNYHRLEFSISDSDVADLKAVIISVNTQIEEGNFSRTTDYRHCQSCELQSHCWPSGIPHS